VELPARKRDLEFAKLLPAFDRKLGSADPLAYLGASGRAIAGAAAEQWGYHVCDALRTTRLALAMAHSNQHPGVHDRISRLSIRASWFNLGVLSLQSSWDRLAQLVRCSLRVSHWPCSPPKKPQEAAEGNTSIWRVLQWIEANKVPSSVDQKLREFWSSPERKGLTTTANRLKHGETFAWRGFAAVPVIEVEHDVPPVEPADAKPKRQDVGWLFSTQHCETLPDGRKAVTRMHYGHKVPVGLDAAVKQVARVYRAFVPVAEAVIREYLGRPASDSPT